VLRLPLLHLPPSPFPPFLLLPSPEVEVDCGTKPLDRETVMTQPPSPWTRHPSRKAWGLDLQDTGRAVRSWFTLTWRCLSASATYHKPIPICVSSPPLRFMRHLPTCVSFPPISIYNTFPHVFHLHPLEFTTSSHICFISPHYNSQPPSHMCFISPITILHTFPHMFHLHPLPFVDIFPHVFHLPPHNNS